MNDLNALTQESRRELASSVLFDSEFLASFWMEMIGGLLISLFVFLIFLLTRPKLRLSPIICKHDRGDGVKFGLKIFNSSYLFHVIDLHVELFLVSSSINTGGPVDEMVQIPLKNCNLLRLEKRPIFPSRHCRYHNAWIFSVVGDLEKLWDTPNTQSLELHVSGVNSLSNLKRIQKRVYIMPNQVIKQGFFVSGSKFEIENN